MSASSLAFHAAAFAVLVLFAPSLRANTYIVDSGGGGQFTDIQSAITAAQPGDVVLVHLGSAGGTYPGFTLDKGLVIIGYGGVNVNSFVQITSIPAGQRAALVSMACYYGLDISNCSGPVFVDGTYFQQTVTTVTASNDVRFAELIPNGDPTHAALAVQGSRVELVDSELRGGNGATNSGGPGTAGLAASAGARVQLARSNSRGGAGSDAQTSAYTCGNGGPALSLAAPVEIFAVGPQVVDPIIGMTGSITGGIGGAGWFEQGFEC